MNESRFRIMGLDYGDKRIGIALTDVTRTICSPYQTYTRTNHANDVKYIVGLIESMQVRIVAVGLPLNMDGTSGQRVERTKEFVNSLKKHTSVKFEFVDERLSSVYAEELLLEHDVSRAKRKELLDKLAAQIILKTFMDTYKGD